MTKSDRQYHKMLSEPIPKLVTEMAVPTVIGMLVTVIYNTADTYFVSQINKSASAAVGAVYPVMAIIQAIGYGIGMGSGSVISRKLGQKENRTADIYASSALAAALIFGLLIGALGLIFLKPFLSILGCSETMMPYAVSYAKYIYLASPISCATFVLNNALRSCGQASLATVGMGTGGIINIILDPILIFSLGLGTAGASIATAVSQCISFLILLSAFIFKKSIVNLKAENVSRDIKTYTEMLTVGLPTIFRQGLGCVSAALLNNSAVVFGDAAVSAITIANKVYTLIRNMVLGIGQGFQPVAGYNYGAGDRKRTWDSFTFSTLAGTLLCAVSTAAVFGFAGPIMRWFSKDPDVVSIGITTLHYVSAVMPFMAFSTYVNQLYQCIGFKVQATVLASCRQGIFFIPLVILLPMKFACNGVEAAQPLSDLLTFFVSVPFIIVFYGKYIKAPSDRSRQQI